MAVMKDAGRALGSSSHLLRISLCHSLIHMGFSVLHCSFQTQVGLNLTNLPHVVPRSTNAWYSLAFLESYKFGEQKNNR